MDDIMYVCKYEGERVPIQSHSCTSYHKLVQVIRDKRSNLSNAQLKLTYARSGLDKLLVRDSEEFASMLRMASIFNMRYIEIEFIGGSAISHVGQDFKGGKFEFRATLMKFAINRGFDFSYKRNDGGKVKAYCKSRLTNPDSNCIWTVTATNCRTKNYFIIRKFIGHHTYEARLNRQDSKHLSTKLMSGLIGKPLRTQKKS